MFKQMVAFSFLFAVVVAAPAALAQTQAATPSTKPAVVANSRHLITKAETTDILNKNPQLTSGVKSSAGRTVKVVKPILGGMQIAAEKDGVTTNFTIKGPSTFFPPQGIPDLLDAVIQILAMNGLGPDLKALNNTGPVQTGCGNVNVSGTATGITIICVPK
jgi:hypothetical protein